jgi:hypothetical protein
VRVSGVVRCLCVGGVRMCVVGSKQGAGRICPDLGDGNEVTQSEMGQDID